MISFIVPLSTCPSATPSVDIGYSQFRKIATPTINPKLTLVFLHKSCEYDTAKSAASGNVKGTKSSTTLDNALRKFGKDLEVKDNAFICWTLCSIMSESKPDPEKKQKSLLTDYIVELDDNDVVVESSLWITTCIIGISTIAHYFWIYDAV